MVFTTPVMSWVSCMFKDGVGMGERGGVGRVGGRWNESC